MNEQRKKALYLLFYLIFVTVAIFISTYDFEIGDDHEIN